MSGDVAEVGSVSASTTSAEQPVPDDAHQRLLTRFGSTLFTASAAASFLGVSEDAIAAALEAWQRGGAATLRVDGADTAYWTVERRPTPRPAPTSPSPPSPPSSPSSPPSPPPPSGQGWTILQQGAHYEIDVGLPHRLPAGPVLPPACRGVAMRRSGASLAGALLHSTTRRTGPVAWVGGKFLVYANGAFRPRDDASFREVLMSWDGFPIGTKKETLGMSKALAGDALSCMRDMLAAPSARFFDGASPGIAFSNGFVTIERNRIRIRSTGPANRARHWIDVPYRRKAKCGRFDRLLCEVMLPINGDLAEAEAKICAFWEWVGVALLGLATKYGKALLLWGPGGSGKSTLLSIVSALWPDELRSAFALQTFEDKFNRAELAGRLLNVCGELPATDADVVETAKAMITGRDDIQARHPFERGFSFRPIAAHLIAANRLPLIGDFTGAFFERFIVLRAEQKFRDTKNEDHSLAEKIIASELGAIASKAITYGTDVVQRGHFSIPPSSKAAINEWQCLSDSVRVWFGETCDADFMFSKKGTAGHQVYAHYRAWSEFRGYRPFANNLFAQHLQALGVPIRASKYGTEWGLAFKAVQ
ncbi:MAG: hypothetical protein KF773_24810 [Deltaproteobacteria bacterium]|nr:hypothetical protein [Deltaproteobacteria bacterium]